VRPLFLSLWLMVLCIPVQGARSQSSANAGSVHAGQALFAVCAGCHGLAGQGNQDVNAPKLAGQEAWYLTRQMAYYTSGVRGGDPADTHGARMAVMALALPNERAVEDVVAYIQTLPDTLPPPTLAGDATRGQGLYAVCTACHGAAGEGNAGLSSPRLIRMDDWYLVSQLTAYLQGVRGTHRDDIYGQQMVPVMSVLTDEQAILDVVAYISSLNRP